MNISGRIYDSHSWRLFCMFLIVIILDLIKRANVWYLKYFLKTFERYLDFILIFQWVFLHAHILLILLSSFTVMNLFFFILNVFSYFPQNNFIINLNPFLVALWTIYHYYLLLFFLIIYSKLLFFFFIFFKFLLCFIWRNIFNFLL